MDVLIRYGFSIEEIKNMMDSNLEIDNISDHIIYDLIDKLSHVGCMSNHIKNIFICNPFLFSRDEKDIDNLIKKLKSIGIENLNILFDSNPLILNMNDSDVDIICKRLSKKGLKKEDIIEYFYYNSYSII